MKKILNGIFMFLKFILLILGFGLSFFIVLSMYKRVDKNLVESIPIFTPYIIILLIFFINIIFGQKSVNRNLFYNLTCCLVFSCIVIVCLRAILDKEYVIKFNYGI